MSFFFRHTPTTQSNFSIQNPAGAAGEGVVFVSQSIWDALCFSGTGESRRVVSIKSKRQHPTGLLSNHTSALACWAIRDPNISDITIPPVWLVTYPAIFQPFQTNLDSTKSVTLSAVEHTVLTEVVLIAKHQDAYKAASAQGEKFENWLFEGAAIIRYGEDLFVPSNVFSACGPLDQPRSLFRYSVSLTSPYKQGIASRGSTKFIVISSDEFTGVLESADRQLDRENLEISESFLISSMLSSPDPLSEANESVRLSEAIFSAEILRTPIDVVLDEVTIYVCTTKLRPLGVLNGDWVLASSVDSSRCRLVRIGALDEAFSDSDTWSAMISPTLLYNLCPRGHRQIVVRGSPYGTRDPVVPMAKSIALTRVASPFTILRRYEPLFIDALHEYFASSKRLVKSGDIISLWIDVDRSMDPQRTLRTGDLTRNITRNYSNVPVYFVVRNVDYDTVTPQTQGGPHVGCFVDTSVTTIIQVGVEHTGVPDVHDYHGFRGARVALPVAIADQMSQLLNAILLDDAGNLGVEPTIFLTGSRGTGKFSVAMHMACHLQMHLVEVNCFDILLDTSAKTETLLLEQVESAISCSPCLIVLRHVDALVHSSPTISGKTALLVLQAVQKCINNAKKVNGKQCILLGIVESGKIPEGLSFSNEIEIKALSEEERFCVLLKQMNIQGRLLASDISIAVLAKKTAALVALDLANLVRKTHLYALIQCTSLLQEVAIHPVMSIKQFDVALLKARTTFAQSIGAPSIPAVFWEDVGGLSLVKNDILDTVQLPLDYPELFQDGLKKRSGILLYGPPGTGKTLIAKAVATSCSLNFLSVKGPELLNMYIGESEANVRRIFQKARDAKPCVIFFDELDSIAPKRGNQGDSGGVMDRIVSQLLAELDGMSAGGMDIFVIGATNRPDLLDPALLRPGRFDRMLYLGVCQTHEAQLDILKALTRKFNLDPSLNLLRVATCCPFNYTGADFYALCADALLHALSHKVAELEEERAKLNSLQKHQQHFISPQFFVSEMKSQAELQLLVKEEDFDAALKELVPSISNAELLHYVSIQKNWAK